MATIVHGFGVAHSTQIHLPADMWPLMGEGDQRNPALIGTDGEKHSYEELLALAGPEVQAALTPEERQARHLRCQQGIERVGELLAQSSLDVLVTVTDDEHYLFSDQLMPTAYTFWGPTFSYGPTILPENAPPAPKAAAWAYGDQRVDFTGAPELGEHLIRRVTDAGFDVACGKALEDGVSIGRPFGFLHTRVFGNSTFPGQVLPVILNASYGPNLAAPSRAYDLGRALQEAIVSWNSDSRVGVVAVGNFSHPVLDEKLDRQLFSALEANDGAALRSLPRANYEGGNGQARVWLVAAAALEGLTMHPIDYVPCYRSPGGTGCGMPFAYWD